jgi:hypothetical protein
MTIKEKVFNFKTRYEEGFRKSEINEILKDFPQIDMGKFNDALLGITCMIIDEEMVIYHCDIENAILCGIENRQLRNYEWD